MNIKAVIRLIRPHHWIKNVFLFAGLVFAVKFTDPGLVLLNLGGFACFCLLASGVYVFNDLMDREADRRHPKRKQRPIAAGQIGPTGGVILSVFLLAGGVSASFALSRPFGLLAAGYVILVTFYTLVLKHVMIADVICLAAGFVLRAIAGAVLIEVPFSDWLVVCTFCICLFMGFGKRRCELSLLADEAANFRKVHEGYTLTLLDHMIDVSAGVALVGFMLYTLDADTIAKIGHGYLMYTVPLVFYCVFRFSALVQSGTVSGPVEIMLRDRAFLAGLVLWGLASIALLWWGAGRIPS